MKKALKSKSRFRAQNPPSAAIFFSGCAKLLVDALTRRFSIAASQPAMAA